MDISREAQAAHDRSEIKIKPIANGFMVKSQEGWFAFDSWEKASAHIAEHLKKIRKPT